jgi:D-alanyl-D-alanine carboxypeptidase/D-alanyl-D-alanine-endopeptidase (penicillin-binding protein 4)
MRKPAVSLLFIWFSFVLYSQEQSFTRFLSDSTMVHASVSFCVIDADSGNSVFEYNSGKSLTPASVMKLITSSAALELLGPEYHFHTEIGYTGNFNKRTGRLNGDIIIKGGGDPALGSGNFDEYYDSFPGKWIDEIKNLGIKKINGRVISDDSYYDYIPVPAKWLWEDEGNYYGAGAYGISVFDNTYEIHLNTASDTTAPVITKIRPEECRIALANWLEASGTANDGFVFAAPYSTSGWLAGTVPANQNDFVLKASITDPPLILAKIVDNKLKAAGIRISGTPSTTRLQQASTAKKIITIDEIVSPPLKEIITVLNHESVNMYAEHLLKELGKIFMDTGSTDAGLKVLTEFLRNAGIDRSGMFISDGSGLSPVNAINARGLADLLLYMKRSGRYFDDFLNSIPYAGKEGTLKNYFSDQVFDSRLKAKSGSMTRVRSFAGYLKTASGKDLIFSIIVNNFTGPQKDIVSHIEEILKETILYK